MTEFAELHFGGERLQLLPERAAFLPEHSTLLLADAHIGKGAHFRSQGIAIPSGSSEQSLTNLEAIIKRYSAPGYLGG